MSCMATTRQAHDTPLYHGLVHVVHVCMQKAKATTRHPQCLNRLDEDQNWTQIGPICGFLRCPKPLQPVRSTRVDTAACRSHRLSLFRGPTSIPRLPPHSIHTIVVGTVLCVWDEAATGTGSRARFVINPYLQERLMDHMRSAVQYA